MGKQNNFKYTTNTKHLQRDTKLSGFISTHIAGQETKHNNYKFTTGTKQI